jgi:hypothetical protein
MQTPEYKLGCFHILLPYAMQFYKGGLQGKTKFNSEWKNLFKENDKMKNFITTYYEQTNNDADRVHKDEFLEAYRTFAETPNVTWYTLLNDINRVGITYHRQLRKKGFATQGCLTGIKRKGVDEARQTKKEIPFAYAFDPLDNGVDHTEQAVKAAPETPKPKSPKDKKTKVAKRKEDIDLTLDLLD